MMSLRVRTPTHRGCWGPTNRCRRPMVRNRWYTRDRDESAGTTYGWRCMKGRRSTSASPSSRSKFSRILPSSVARTLNGYGSRSDDILSRSSCVSGSRGLRSVRSPGAVSHGVKSSWAPASSARSRMLIVFSSSTGGRGPLPTGARTTPMRYLSIRSSAFLVIYPTSSTPSGSAASSPALEAAGTTGKPPWSHSLKISTSRLPATTCGMVTRSVAMSSEADTFSHIIRWWALMPCSSSSGAPRILMCAS
mmetsp:Transcript_207/g.587  ORF Transcript_207/g.587 Transcript_207/m.587 type:complete len:249 (-) Transcript_207:1134-1880(-)